jgi:hypothetical protein
VGTLSFTRRFTCGCVFRLASGGPTQLELDMKTKISLLAAAAVAVAAATQIASAGSSGQSSLLDLLQASEAAASAAAATRARVVSEAPFQKLLGLACTGDGPAQKCRARLPAVAVGERLVIQFASCIANTTLEGEMGPITAVVTNPQQTQLFAGHFIAPTFRGGAASTIHIASQPMLLTVDAGRILLLEAGAHGGTLSLASCGLSGVRQKLG